MANGSASDPGTTVTVRLLVDPESEWIKYAQAIDRGQLSSMKHYYAGVRGHRCEVLRPPETARRQGLHPCYSPSGVPMADPLANLVSGESGLRAGEVAVGDLEGVVPPPLAPLPPVGPERLKYYSVAVPPPYPVGGRFGAARRVFCACDLEHLQQYYVGPPGARRIELWKPNEAESLGFDRCFRFEGPEGTRVPLADPLAEGAGEAGPDALLDLVDVPTGDERYMLFTECIGSKPIQYGGDLIVVNGLVTQIHNAFNNALQSLGKMAHRGLLPPQAFKNARSSAFRMLAKCHVLMKKIRKELRRRNLSVDSMCLKHSEGETKNPIVDVINGLIEIDLDADYEDWNAQKGVRLGNKMLLPVDHMTLSKLLPENQDARDRRLASFLKDVMIRGFKENRDKCPMFLKETNKAAKDREEAAEKRNLDEIKGELEREKRKREEVESQLREFECVVCFKHIEYRVMVCTPGGHCICRGCFQKVGGVGAPCPVCRDAMGFSVEGGEVKAHRVR